MALQELVLESLENQEIGFNDGCGPSALPYSPPFSNRGGTHAKPELSDGNHITTWYPGY